MKMIALLAFAATAFAQSASKFEVKEINHETVRQLAVANTNLEAAAKALIAAQKAAADAQEARDKIVGKLDLEYGAFEGYCTYMGGAEKRFVRVEIRDKYALITSGTQSCPTALISTTPSIGHLAQ